MLIYAVVGVFVIAPALMFSMGFWRGSASSGSKSLNWKMVLGSALCCSIAFNLIFFIQEVGLVLPKAFTPGLTPTLFHNNHSWIGDHDLAYLFQGTGALATLITGVFSYYLVKSNYLHSVGGKLFFWWMAYHGIFMALPQVVIGAINPYNDVGMAMDYFNLSQGVKTALAWAAILVMPLCAMMLASPILSLVSDKNLVSDGKARSLFIWQVISLPALISIFLIVPFRVPREWIEVIVLPVIVLFAGVIWVQASGWKVNNPRIVPDLKPLSLRMLLLSALGLLLIFQVILRPGITLGG